MTKLLMLCIAALSFWPGGNRMVWCKLSNEKVVFISAKECAKRGGEVVHKPNPRPTPIVNPSPTPTSTPTPTVMPTKIPTPTSVVPTPTPANLPTISKVEVFDGTSGESTYGYVTGVKATGTNIGPEARMVLSRNGLVYTGMYQGGDGSTWILTDFLGLPHCQTFDVTVNGDNGGAVYLNGVNTVCP